MKVKILTDTSCGILKKEAEALGYEMISLPFILDDIEYDEDGISKEEFYKKIRESKNIHTSQAPIDIVIKKIDKLLKENDYVIYFPITSGLSGAYSSGVMLENDEKYKNRLFCVNHRTISVAQRAMLEDVKKMIDMGVHPQKIKQIIENNSKNCRVYICVNTLDYLKKGGRVSPLVASIGNLLNIKPILASDGGSFEVIKKARSMKIAEENLKELLKSSLNDLFNETDVNKFAIGVAYVEDIEEGIRYRDELKEFFNIDIIFDELPSVISCHIGTGAIGVAIYKRVNEY